MEQRRVQHCLDQVEAPAGHEARRRPGWVARHPILFGMLLSVLLAATILVVDVWLPGTEHAVGKHRALLNAVLFTLLFFGTFAYGFWRFHRLPGFWLALAAVLVAHAVGILYYTFHVHPLFLLQWSVVGFCDAWASGICLAWLAWWRERRARAIR